MCEFKVVLEDDGKLREVASDIIHIKLEGNMLMLRDIIGKTVKLKSAIITEVNVPREELKLYSNSLLDKVLTFIKKYNECVRTGTYSEDLEELWEEVKAEGSEMIRSLWTKLRG